MRRSQGFSLIEVVIALGILGIGLAALLESHIASLNTIDRSRSLTIASLLARSKMIDIEQHLLDEGFKLGEEEDRGNFEAEGHPEIKWSYKSQEVRMDLSTLTSMAGGDNEKDKKKGDAEKGGMLGNLEMATQLLKLDEIAQGLRLVDLTITWTDAGYQDQMTVRTLVTRPNFDATNVVGMPP